MGCNNSIETEEPDCIEPNNQNRSGASARFSTQATGKITVWEIQALERHNAYRSRHGVPPLVLNSDITRKAQAYAKYLADNNLFEHSKNRDNLGENLYTMSSSEPLTNQPLGADATVSWYNEIESYDFDDPGFSSETGHFTQVIWKSTTSLGVGVAFGDDGRRAVVVAQYGPAGNMLRAFPENVPPPL